jgi:serine/threonine-protein kinase RsbW
MEIHYGLRLPREVVTVPIVRDLCRTAMTQLGVEEACVQDVALALTEACANVVEHAEGTDDDYEVRLQLDNDRCQIRVVDTGRGFDADGLADESMPDTQSERGRGIQLMKALVDRVTFTSTPEKGTIVHFEKALELLDDSPLHSLRVRPKAVEA